MGCSTKYRTESSFRIEGGMRYQMLTRKVEIHISPRANKKLLSPRALSFAGAPWETTSRKGTMQEEKSGNRICYSLVEERTYRQSRTRASSFILPIDRPTACARIERTRSAKEYENWRVAAETFPVRLFVLLTLDTSVKGTSIDFFFGRGKLRRNEVSRSDSTW